VRNSEEGVGEAEGLRVWAGTGRAPKEKKQTMKREMVSLPRQAFLQEMLQCVIARNVPD